MFGPVIVEKFVGCLLDRFPLLFAGFLFDDLAVALLQPLALAALLRDRLRLAGGAGGAAVPPPVQLELVMVERAVLENAHCVAVFRATAPAPPFITSVAGTVKSKIGAAGQVRAWVRLLGFAAPPPPGCDSRKAVMSPILYRIDRAVDSPERAADVQPSFVLQHFHAAPADGGVYVLVDPRPWDRQAPASDRQPEERCSYRHRRIGSSSDSSFAEAQFPGFILLGSARPEHEQWPGLQNLPFIITGTAVH